MNLFRRLRDVVDLSKRTAETQLLLLGREQADRIKAKSSVSSLREVEFKVFSQFGDDGIIQWLTANLDIPKRTFVEFGVEDYSESNTRFLLINDNWSGAVIDGSKANVARIREADYYWRHELMATAAFIDRDNINRLLEDTGLGSDVGLLSIDLDGNDYWILKSIEVVSPIVLILEYNSVFGPDRHWTIPYDATFRRERAHFSHLYWGASLAALSALAGSKGYAFVGCNSAGNNAYYVRRDKMSDSVRQVEVARGFVGSKFRESRDRRGAKTFLSGSARLEAIRGLPIYNTETDQLETI